MALSECDKDYPHGQCEQETTRGEVYRVIDDGDCILTTLDARKALIALMKLIEKHDVTVCWADVEPLK